MKRLIIIITEEKDVEGSTFIRREITGDVGLENEELKWALEKARSIIQ